MAHTVLVRDIGPMSFALTRSKSRVNVRRVQTKIVLCTSKRLGAPLVAGRIGKRVRLPRGRATVMRIVNASGNARFSKPGDLPTRFAAF